MANREDIRNYARDYIYEATADLLTDARLNNGIDHTMRELPTKGVYLEEVWTKDMEENKIGYTLPTGTIKVEKLEQNMGTTTLFDWQEISGWDNYGGAIYLRSRPTIIYTMRAHLKKRFTILAADETVTDVPDDKLELVAIGTALRAYKMLMGYFMRTANWDAIGKPDGTDMGRLSRWIRQLDEDYNKLIKSFRTVPRARSINLTD